MESRQYKRTANKHVDAFTEHSINNTRITITEYGETLRCRKGALWKVIGIETTCDLQLVLECAIVIILYNYNTL